MPTPSKKAKKYQTMKNMPNTMYSCQTTLKKAKFLKFGLKNGNPGTGRKNFSSSVLFLAENWMRDTVFLSFETENRIWLMRPVMPLGSIVLISNYLGFNIKCQTSTSKDTRLLSKLAL